MNCKTSAAYNRLIVVAALLSLVFVLTANHAYATTASAQEPTASPTPTPLSPEEQRLADEKKILTLNKDNAELRKAIAEANKAELEAKFPKPTTSPLAGTTTVSDGAVIESQMVAYVSMAKAANTIIRGIKKHQSLAIKRLAVYNERDVNLLLSYQVANGQIKLLQQRYCDLLDPKKKTRLCHDAATPPGPQREIIPLLSAAQSFLGAFIDMTALLRTNVEIKGQTFDIDEAPLVAEVFRAARGSDGLANVELYYPFVMPPNIDLNRPSEILRVLEDLHSLRASAGNLLDDLAKKKEDLEKSKAKVKELEGSIKTLQNNQAAAEAAALRLLQSYCLGLADASTDILIKIGSALRRRACPGLPGEKRERLLELRDNILDMRSELSVAEANLRTEQTKRDTLAGELAVMQQNVNDDAVAQLKALNEQLDKFVNALVAVDAGTGFNPITTYIKAENLLSALPQDDNSYWLQLKVLKAGGNNRIKTNLLIDIFTGGNRVSHSGGAIVQYNLFNVKGKSVASDTITDYTNYIKANKVRKLPTAEVDDLP